MSQEEYRFSVNDDVEVGDALKEILQTSLGEEYKRDYYSKAAGEQHLAKILNAAQLIAGGPQITVGNMSHALRLLLDSGEIQPREIEFEAELAEPEPDTRPRTRDGKLMTQAQIQWSEFRQFSETASTKDIAERKRIDPAFASFVRKNLEREMTGGGVADAVTPAGQSKLPRHDASNELAAFARAYLTEPTNNLKPRNGLVTLGGQPMTWTRFNELLNKATEAHLI